MPSLAALVRFSRLHTIIATTVQVGTLFLIVAGHRHVQVAALAPLGLAWLACLALNLYVVGVNQLTDIAIDRINKPRLPLASGEISPQLGQVLSYGAGALALALGMLAGPYLLMTVVLILVIGTLYSLPPLRLKRFAIPAALSIALARGLFANLGLALHYSQIFGERVPLLTVALIGLFFFGFGLVIAIYKDMPDAAGDRQHNIETLTTRLGIRRVLLIGQLLLGFCYAIPIILALFGLPRRDAIFLLAAHMICVIAFWWASAQVNLASKRSISNFYMFLWVLFYTEFGVLSVYELTRRMVV